MESGYSSYWRPPGVGSFNWGAIQGTGPAGAFQYVDTHPNADGTSTPYAISFRKYHSLAEGAEDLVRVVYQIASRDKSVLPAATRGDTLGFSSALHSTGYYEGAGKTVADRIANHHRAVLNACTLMAREIGEPMPDESEPAPIPPLALHQGAIGPAVTAWQKILNALGFACAVDGAFGPGTRNATVAFQISAHLVADGVVGEATKEAAAKVAYPGAPNS